MPRSKTQSPCDDTAVEGRKVRRRVVKACQRCRLKKCKALRWLDSMYSMQSRRRHLRHGKHKKSDKIIFRKGYVQMLARQHTQLIAGLQELYRRTQTGEGWVGPLPDPVNYGQPLTHKILEALGVLQQDEWDDNDDIDGSAWQSFEQQAHDVASMYPSTAASPVTQSTFSQVSAPIGAIPNSTIMAKRRSRDQGDAISAVSQTIQMPPRLATTFPPFDKHVLPCTTADAEFSMPARKGPFDLDDANIEFNSQGRMLNTDMDWVFGTDDMFCNSAGQGIPLQVGVS